MPTITFRRDANITSASIPVVDGQILFDTATHQLFMDSGSERYQYGGSVEIVSTTPAARADNVYSALASNQIFLQKTTIIDSKSNALAVTQQYIPLGCLAFKETIGTTNFSSVGSTVSSALVALGNRATTVEGKVSTIENELTANNRRIYMDYQGGKYGYNTSANRGADTFHPFSGYEYLGVGTSFNVSNIQGYQNFTADNFVCEPTAVAVIPSNYGYNEGGGHNVGQWGITGGSGGVTKSYDASTGVLTAYLSASCACGVNSHSVSSGSGAVAVKCYLILS